MTFDQSMTDVWIECVSQNEAARLAAIKVNDTHYDVIANGTLNLVDIYEFDRPVSNKKFRMYRNHP